MTITPSQIASMREAASKALDDKDQSAIPCWEAFIEECTPERILALLDAYEELQIVRDSLTESYLLGVHSERTHKINLNGAGND